MRKLIENRFFLVIARTLDHRIGKTDSDKPDIPILTVEEALVSFFIRLFVFFINVLTCSLVIANIIHHW
jgi:hypothetical protein